jgi:hypothetical protein
MGRMEPFSAVAVSLCCLEMPCHVVGQKWKEIFLV